MLTTKALLNPFHHILPRIHHPPPIDKRESKRLLKALTESFRSHLDREHGYMLSHDPPAPSKTYNIKSSSSPPPPTAARDAYQRPTDRHVRAILSNPLFAYEPPKPTCSNPSTDRDPMDVFDQAVAKGLMNPQRAIGVLIAKRQAIAQSSSVSVNEGMAASGTAHRVVSWLRSSGLERNLEHVNYKPLLTQLLPFMIEEGLEDVVWLWLDQWMRAVTLDVSMRFQMIRASPLLMALIRAKVSRGHSLDAGYATLVQAEDRFAHLDLFAETALRPWTTLSALSTVFTWQRTPPSAALYNSFVAMSISLRRLRNSIIFDRAHLDLHHPTEPDAAAALSCLKSPFFNRLSLILGGSNTRLEDADGWRSNKRDARKLVLMATDAAQHLTRVGKTSEAEWVGDVLIEKLGNFLRTELVKASPKLHLMEST